MGVGVDEHDSICDFFFLKILKPTTDVHNRIIYGYSTTRRIFKEKLLNSFLIAKDV